MSQLPACYDPLEQFRRNDLASAARERRRPKCLRCGRYILSEECLDLTPFGVSGYACEQCVECNTHRTDELEGC